VVDVGAWCGLCGESFRLAELVESGFTGACPRCGRDLAGDYSPVVSAAVHEVILAADALAGAAGRVGAAAPHLHLDARKLTEDFAAVLDAD
jgi:hypothetical protein